MAKIREQEVETGQTKGEMMGKWENAGSWGYMGMKGICRDTR